MDTIGKNRATEVGIISGELQLSHISYGRKIYEAFLDVARTSGTVDKIPLLIPEGTFRPIDGWDGKKVIVSGNLRTMNMEGANGGRNRLLIHLFVQYMIVCDDDTEISNHIFLDGYICKKGVLRVTPLGRNICEFILAVDRPNYRKSDYIPCICWWDNAQRMESLHVGDNLRIDGRIQSRIYDKMISGTESETRTTYEVSVSRMEVVSDAKKEAD